MKMFGKLIALGFAAALVSGSALAQAPAAAPSAPKAAAPATPPSAAPTAPAPTAAQPARSPQSLECSKEADAKGLHGKARKKFKKECKKGVTGEAQ